MKQEITKQSVLQELAAIGFARATDYLQLTDGSVCPGSLTPEQGAAIAAVERTASGVKIKFYDKLRALELLGKCLGLFEGGAVPEGGQSNLLEAIVEATRQSQPDRCEVSDL